MLVKMFVLSRIKNEFSIVEWRNESANVEAAESGAVEIVTISKTVFWHPSPR